MTGPRIRPRTGTSVARSIAGGLSVRAAGTTGVAMLGHTGSHGRGMVARVPGASACMWSLFGGHNEVICWPSEPRGGPVPVVGFPSGGSEVPRILHGIPFNDDPTQTYLAPCVVGTADDWWPPVLAAPWDDSLAVMIAQESVADVYVYAYAFLTDAAGEAAGGSGWFGLYQNGLIVASTPELGSTAGAMLYRGAINAGDRFHISYQTDVVCPGGGQQGVAWSLWLP